ncbi:MAG TPA: S9 family peptidase, partial [Longimicrobiaceae bacterium]|nr:S9 family peptidase [Longimicrobiaceae bacterium]
SSPAARAGWWRSEGRAGYIRWRRILVNPSGEGRTVHTRLRHSLVRAAALGLLAAAAAPATAQAPKEQLHSVQEALAASRILAGRSGPASVNWVDGGNRFSYTTYNAETKREEVRRFDPNTLQDQLLFDNRVLTLPGTAEPLRYRSFQWAADSRHVVFQANFRPIYRKSGVADFYIYDVQTKELKLAVKDARTAELSPDGTMVGFERGGNMFVYDIDTGTEKQLTTEGTDSVFNGVHDWVYEEEFGEAQAWKWSRDSRYIAFWQTDERGVPVTRLTDYESQHPEWIRYNYPKVGDHNPEVRIGVVNVQSGERRWLDTGLSGDFYIPRIYWTSEPGTLAVVTLNRAQNHVRLFFFDVNTGARRQVMEETSKAWIDISDFYAGVNDFFTFPAGLKQFFWISDRDGHQHVYRYDYSGKLLNQVTNGPWTVTRVEGIDPAAKTIYYTSTEASPLQRQLYAIRFDGTHERRLTQTAGTHEIDLSPNGKYYIDSWSSVHEPRTVELWSTAGKKLQTLEANQETRDWLETHAYSPAEVFHFTTSDGVQLDGSMIKPPVMEPGKRYPVLFSIYGGPGSQEVYDRFNSNGWYQYLAQQGYIVVGLNNRGTNNYSRDFMEIVYGQLGKWESHDFAEAARYLKTLPYVDGDHMAIQGTSYGGYSTVYTMLQHPDVFALGIANSAVTDWRLYDSIYTERYMGLLSENETGYEQSSAIPFADRLQGHLLMVHSTMDDNVHPQNTMQMLTAFSAIGKDVEVRLYPPGGHGAAFNGPSYLVMTQVYTNELCEYLKPGCETKALNEK